MPQTNFLFYKGPVGQLRLSRQVEDKDDPVPGAPIASMDQMTRIEEGKTIMVEASVTPIGMAFREGEKLRMRIGGRDDKVFPPVDQATLDVDGLRDVNENAIVQLDCGMEDKSWGSYIIVPLLETSG